MLDGSKLDADVAVGSNDDREWYTFKRGEDVEWLINKAGLDMATLKKLNPHVDLAKVFPGDRIVIRMKGKSKPKDRAAVGIVGQPTNTVLVMPRPSTWSSSIVFAGVLVTGILTGAAFVTRSTRLSTVFMYMRGGGIDSAIRSKDDTIQNLENQRHAAEIEFRELQEKWKQSERSIFTLQQLLESASKSDTALREHVSLLKDSLDSKDVDLKRLESSNAEAGELLEQCRRELALHEAELEVVRGSAEVTESQLSEMKIKVSEYEYQMTTYREKAVDMESELMALRELSMGFSNDATATKEKYKEKLGEITRLKEMNVKLEIGIGKANEQVTLALNQLDTYRKDMERLERELAASRSDVYELKTDVQNANARIVSLENALDASNNENSKLTIELEDSVTELEATKGDKSRLTNELSDLKSELADLKGELTTVENKLTDKLAMAEEALAASNSDKSKLTAELTERTAELDAARDDRSRLTNELDSLQAELERMRAQLDAANKESSSALDELVGVRNQLDAVQSALDTARSEASQYRGELDSARGESGALSNELAGLRVKVGELEAALAASGDDASGLSAELANLRDKLATMETELEHAQAEASARGAELERAKRAFESEIDEKNQMYELVREDLSRQAAAASEEAAQIGDQLKDLELALSILKGEANDYRASAESYKDELEAARLEIVALSADRDGSFSGSEVFESKAESLQLELDTLRVKAAVSAEEAEKYQVDLFAARAEVSKLQAEIAEIHSQRASQADSQGDPSRISELEEELARLLTISNAHEAELTARTRGEVDAANERADRYKKRLLELEEKMQDKLESLSETFSLTTDSPHAQAINADVSEALRAVHLSLAQIQHIVATMNQQSRGEFFTRAISCEFKVRKDVGEGEFLVLVGSWNDWDVEKGENLHRSGDGSWTTTISLFADEPHEYKYCVCKLNEHGRRVAVEWQVGHNHGFAFDSSLISSQGMQPRVEIRDKFWADPAHTPIILFGSNGEKFETGSTALLHGLTNHIAEAGFDTLRANLEQISFILSRNRENEGLSDTS